MFTLTPHLKFVFEADVYKLRVRPGYPHVMVNHGYDEIRILDCINGKEVGKASFPESDFSIYAWVSSPDGSRSFLFNSDENDHLLELDVERLHFKKIAINDGFNVPTELCWFTPQLHILDYKYRVWTLSGNVFVQADAATADQLYTRPYRRITKRYTVDKMDPYGNGVYVRSRPYPEKTIGRVSWDGQEDLLVKQEEDSVDVTHYQQSLFVNLITTVVQYADGDHMTMLESSDDDHFICVDVVRHEGTAYLNVLSSTKDYLSGAIATLNVYQITLD